MPDPSVVTPAATPSVLQPALHGLRGVACVLIVLHHFAVLHPMLAAQLVRSTLRPEVFFVVSGALYRRKLVEVADLAGFAAFARRLLRRLYPAYLVFLLLATAGYAAKHWALHHGGGGFRSASVFDDDPAVLWKNLVLLQDVWPTTTVSLNYPSWAIGDFVWVALVAALTGAAWRGRARTAVLAALGAAGYALVLAWPDGPWFDLGRCAASFVTGVGAGALAARLGTSRAWGGALALAACAAMLALMQFDAWITQPFAEMPPMAALAVVGLSVAPASAIARALSWRPLVALGRLSYTIILCHALVLMAVERLLERFAGTRCARPEVLCERGLSAPATLAAIVAVLAASIVLAAAAQRLLAPRPARLAALPAAA